MNRRTDIRKRTCVAVGLAGLFCAVCASVSAASPGYLHVGKPKGLRFEPVSATRIDLTLPPVAADDSARSEDHLGENGQELASVQTRLGQLPTFALPGSPLEILFEPANEEPFASESSSSMIDQAEYNHMVPGDALIDYFVTVRSGTNSSAGAVIPVRFTPPTPAGPPASRATYRTP